MQPSCDNVRVTTVAALALAWGALSALVMIACAGRNDPLTAVWCGLAVVAGWVHASRNETQFARGRST